MNYRYLLSVVLCAICVEPPVCIAFDKAQNSAQDSIQDHVQNHSRTVISVHGISGQLQVTEAFLLTEDHHIVEKNLIDILSPQINLQLKYLVGQIHGLEGGLELHKTQINELEKVEVLASGLAIYRYTATINAVLSSSWVINASESLSMSVYLPRQVDELSLKKIYDLYVKDCIPNPHRSYADTNYWYYFRPQAYYCPLREQHEGSSLISDQFINVDLVFTPNPQPNKELFPQYKEMWRDNRLVVTAVYALVGGLLGEQGQEAYQMVFKDLVRSYGEPIKINDESLLNRSILDVDTPFIEATFATPKGPLEVHLFLINSLDQPSHIEGGALNDFRARYNALTQTSDFIIYNGHARYGSDNAKLDALGETLAQHHQLFFVNTCASYTYGLPNATKRAFEANSAEARPNEYLDLIVNAMPAMGHEIAYMNLRYINALTKAQESYQSILEDMYSKQQMLVLTSRGIDAKNDLVNQNFNQEQAELHMGEKQQVSSGCDATQNTAARMPYYALIVLFLVFIRQTFPDA